MGRGITEFALRDPDFTIIQLFENPEYPKEKLLEVFDQSKIRWLPLIYQRT